MVTILEETQTPVFKNGKPVYRRVYSIDSMDGDFPNDNDAPGSIAIVKDSDVVNIYILFADGFWAKL